MDTAERAPAAGLGRRFGVPDDLAGLEVDPAEATLLALGQGSAGRADIDLVVIRGGTPDRIRRRTLADRSRPQDIALVVRVEGPNHAGFRA